MIQDEEYRKEMPQMTEIEKLTISETTKAEQQQQQQSGSSTDSDTDEEIPELEDAGGNTATSTTGAAGFQHGTSTGLPIDMVSKAKQSRGEKKARKIMSKLGLKPVSAKTTLTSKFK